VNQILVYVDEGVEGRSARHALSALIGLVGLGRVRRVNHWTLRMGGWEASTALVVMPGGRDLPYLRRLGGQGNRRLRQFVEQGGAYLGLCAGGYYGAARVAFEVGGPLEVVGPRELGFYPGTASGPAYGKNQFDYKSEAGARAARIIHLPTGKRASVYFNGGCAFLGPQEQAVAHYADLPGTPAAIVHCRVGLGHALLSGVHLEANPWRLSSPQPWLQELRATDPHRRTLLRTLLQPLLTRTEAPATTAA